jgi:hypothetical protein
MYQNVIMPILRVGFDTAGLGLPYVAINPLGLPESCFKVIIVNDSNVGVTISYDGANAADYIRADSDRVIECVSDEYVWSAKGQKYYISGAGAGVGYVYVVGYYR